jgi:hypothetical protein
MLQTDCPIYSLTIGETNCDIPLTPYEKILPYDETPILNRISSHPYQVVPASKPSPNPTPNHQAFSLFDGPDSLDKTLANNATSVPYSKIKIEPEINTPSESITINEADIKNNPTETDPYDIPLSERDHINLEPFRQFDINNKPITTPVEKVEFDLKHLNTEEMRAVLDVLDKHEKLFSDKD